MEITKDGGILQFGKPEWGSGKFAENGEWLDIRAEKKWRMELKYLSGRRVRKTARK